MDMNPEERQAVSEELERILSSSGFVRNERLSRFLRFLVERHLDGRDDEIKESLIGVEVFGRRPDYDPKQDSIVRTEAARLRARLFEYYAGEGGEDPVIVEVPKGGYGPVFRHRKAALQERARGSRFRLAIALVALATVLVTAAGWWRLRAREAPIRIGVLPLENLSPDPTSEYFADGLTDEIIGNLSVIDGLAVRSRTSSFAFKNKPRNIAEVGRLLDVDYILEGSVVRTPQQVRIHTQLVRVRDDFPVWSGKYDRPLTDVLAIQDDISRGIVNNLRFRLGRGRRRYEVSVEAYDLYLRARAHNRQNPPGFSASIEGFKAALEKDSSFAPAYAGLASTYALRSIQFALDHPADELTQMRAAAEKAIQLDPLLAEAHDAMGMIAARDGHWEESEKNFRHAIELDPNRSLTYDNFAIWLLMVLGRQEEALQQLRLAEKADPLSPAIRAHLGLALISAERYDEAAALCAKLSAAADASSWQCLARVKLGQGAIGAAMELLADDPNLPGNPQARGFLGHIYARAGRRAEAEKLAAASHFPNEQALIFAGLGDKDRTLEALDRMAVLGAQRVGMMLNYPELTLLRGDPRVHLLRQKLGLPR